MAQTERQFKSKERVVNRLPWVFIVSNLVILFVSINAQLNTRRVTENDISYKIWVQPSAALEPSKYKTMNMVDGLQIH